MKKHLFLLLILPFICNAAIAQEDIKTFRKSRNSTSEYEFLKRGPGSTQRKGVNSEDTVISRKAFSKLVKQDIMFTLIGAQSPTPGFALDLSNKLSAKLTGFIPTKRKIVTMDFEASQNENNIPVFAEGKFNGQLSASINFNWIPGKTLKISDDIIWGNTYPYADGADKLVAELTRIEEAKYETLLTDSVAVLSTFLKLVHEISLESIYNEKFKKDKTGKKILGNAIEKTIPSILTKDESGVFEELKRLTSRQQLFIKLATNYFSFNKEYKQIDSLAMAIYELKQLPITSYWKVDKLFLDLQRVCNSYLDSDNSKIDEQINRSKPYWLRKQLHWFTFSAKPVLHTLNSFSDDINGSKVKVGSLNFFEFETPLWYQFYDVRKKGGNLWRVGVTFVYGSNRKGYKTAKYISTDTLINYTNNVVIKQDQKEGVYNDGTNPDYKLYANWLIEYYRLPRRNFVPGFTTRLGYLRDAAFGIDNGRKLRLETGAVLNILNKEKNQSAISLQPYIAITNLKDEKIQEGDITRSKTTKEKLNMGIRIGLPIRGQLAVQ